MGESYEAVMGQRPEIMRRATGLDYSRYASGALAFDYDALFADTGYDSDRVRAIQAQTAVGDTPLVELRNITALARSLAPPGWGRACS
jgi:hypothetical protein